MHGYCGSTLRACAGDLLDFAHMPTREDMLKSYITLSRLAQPFSPMVFRQGLLPGPHLLMEFWRGCMKMQQMQVAWGRSEQKENKQKSNLKSIQWPCGACRRELPCVMYGVDSEDRT